jgi:hypothetical protein
MSNPSAAKCVLQFHRLKAHKMKASERFRLDGSLAMDKVKIINHLFDLVTSRVPGNESRSNNVSLLNASVIPSISQRLLAAEAHTITPSHQSRPSETVVRDVDPKNPSEISVED